MPLNELNRGPAESGTGSLKAKPLTYVRLDFYRERVIEAQGVRNTERGIRSRNYLFSYPALSGGVSRVLCKRPSVVLGDGALGKGAFPLPQPISVEAGCAFIA
jgi:hypothetical protein